MLKRWRHAHSEHQWTPAHESSIIAIDVLFALDLDFDQDSEIPKTKIYMNPSLLYKMCDHQWHTILINTMTMRTIGIIIDKNTLIKSYLAAHIGNHPGIVLLVYEYAKEHFFMAEDRKMYECGVYKLYAMNHRFLC